MLLLMFTLNCTKGVGQSNLTGNWLIYFGNQKINQKWNIHNEVQYRNYNWLGDASQLLFRIGIGYDLSENNNNIMAGYGFIKSYIYQDYSSSKKELDEHRIFQQFITKHQWKSLFLTHRIRSEERFIEKDFSFRMRYFLLINIPLNKQTLEKEAIYLASSDEIFFNVTDGKYDRNRIYMGLGYAFNKYVRTEAGFMVQHTLNASQKQFQIILINNLPLKKQS